MIFSCSVRASVNADRALASSFCIRAMTPSTKGRLKTTFSLAKVIGFSPEAIKASLAPAASCSANAQKKPVVSDTLRGVRICCPDFVDELAQWSGIGFPIQFDECARCFYLEIVRLDGRYAIQHGFCFGIAPEKLVTQCRLLQRENVARIEIGCAFQISHGLFPSPLASLDVTF